MNRYVTQGTFATGSGDILVRVVRDSVTGICSLYVLTENARARQYAVIAVSTPNSQRAVAVTDNKGKAILQTDTPVNWESATVTVLVPRAVLTIATALQEKTELASEGVHLSVTRNGEAVTMRFGTQTSALASMVAVSAVGTASFHTLIASEVTIPVAQASDVREIRVFT